MLIFFVVVLETKKTFNPFFQVFFFYSPAWYMEAVTKAAVEKSCSYLG